MTASRPYHQPLPPGQEQLTDLQLAKTCPPGVGVSVSRHGLYWDVVLRLGSHGKPEYIVTDGSVLDRKPQLVHGPVTSRSEATDWARQTALLFFATHGQCAT